MILSYIRGFAGAFGLLLLCFVFEKTFFDKPKNLLKYIGRSTLIILGTHMLFVIILKVVVAMLGGIPDNVAFIVSMIGSCIITLIGAVIYHYVEIKYPFVVGKRTDSKQNKH